MFLENTTQSEYAGNIASRLCDVVFRTELPEPFTGILQHIGRCSEDETHVVGDAKRLAGNAEEVLFLYKGCACAIEGFSECFAPRSR